MKRDLWTELINKELEKHNVTVEDIKEDKEWFNKYTFDSKEEYNNWRDYCIKAIKKHYRISKSRAEKEFAMFSLCYGLRLNYED